MFTRPIARAAFVAAVLLAPLWPAVAAATNDSGTPKPVPEVTTTTTVPETTTTTVVIETTTTVVEDTVPPETTTTAPATTVVEETSTTAPPATTTLPPEATTPPTVVDTVPETTTTTIPTCPEGMFPSNSSGDLPCLPEDPCTSSGFTVWHFQPCTVEQNQPPPTPTTTTIPPGTRMLPETGREIETILIIGLILAGLGSLAVWACSRQFDEGEWQ